MKLLPGYEQLKIDTVHLADSRSKGAHLLLEERPLWAVLAETIGDYLFEPLNKVAEIIPEWIRWGPPGEEHIKTSLSYQLFRFAQQVAGGFGAWRHTREIATVPVDEAWIRVHYPDAGWPFIRDENEAQAAPERPESLFRQVDFDYESKTGDE